MSFTSGFEKTAFIASALGAAGGTISKATKGTVKAVKGFASGQKAKGIESYRRASGVGSKAAPGAGLAARRAPGGKVTPEVAGKARADLFARKDRADASKQTKKPSWARKHPFLTAGGLYLGARTAFGGGDDKDQRSSQPQVIPGQY